MQEKVIVVSSESHMIQPDVTEVNQCLEQGWTVKSVTTDAHNGWATAIFILQKGA